MDKPAMVSFRTPYGYSIHSMAFKNADILNVKHCMQKVVFITTEKNNRTSDLKKVALFIKSETERQNFHTS